MNEKKFDMNNNFFTRAGYDVTHRSGRLILDENAGKWAVIGSEEVYDLEGVEDIEVGYEGGTADGMFIAREVYIGVRYGRRKLKIPVQGAEDKPCVLWSGEYERCMELAREGENLLGWFAPGGGKRS